MIAWKTGRVGERTWILDEEDGGPGVVIVPSGIPDWVQVPDETPHTDAGRRFRVEFVRRVTCPACRDHEVPLLVLAGSDLVVGMCPTRGWVLAS